MPQLIHRGMDICAHRRLNQVFPVITLTGLKQVFYGRANCIYDSTEGRIASTIPRRFGDLLSEGCSNSSRVASIAPQCE